MRGTSARACVKQTREQQVYEMKTEQLNDLLCLIC